MATTDSAADSPAWRLAAGLLLVSLAGAPAAATAAGPAVRLDDPDLASVARRVPVGGALRVEGIQLPGGDGSALELRRFRVFPPNARVVVHGAAGPRLVAPPRRADFRGGVAGVPGSLAVLSVVEGEVRGWVEIGGRRRGLGAAAAGGPPLAPAGGGQCAAGELPDVAAAAAARLPALAPPEGAPAAGPVVAEMAVETDWELFDKLGSAAAVAGYAGDLFAAASAIYLRDVGTALEVVFLSVWETPDDPFEVTSGFLDALLELGDYWHANHLETPRTLTHLLSGKNGIAGGIAFHGVLCSPDLPYQGHWGGGYALSGALVSSGAFRDTVIMSHELGHNFRSHHTHCYNDLPEPGAPPIDHCFSGETRNDGHPCYAGAVGLPVDGGSLMGYCHLLPGGYGNVTLSLGEKGAFGERSERVIQRITEHVASVGCLRPLDEPIFSDGFESGDTAAWSAAVP